MKGLTKTTLWEFLESIRDRTRENIMEIRHNNDEIVQVEREILQQKLTKPEKLSDLKIRNKQLSEENFQLLELHKSIITLGERYGLYASEDIVGEKEEVEEKEPVTQTEADCIEKAINGGIDFDNPGSCFEDEKTVTKIYEALLAQERYEECAKILKYTKKNDAEENEIPNEQMDNKFLRFLFWRKQKNKQGK